MSHILLQRKSQHIMSGSSKVKFCINILQCLVLLKVSVCYAEVQPEKEALHLCSEEDSSRETWTWAESSSLVLYQILFFLAKFVSVHVQVKVRIFFNINNKSNRGNKCGWVSK